MITKLLRLLLAVVGALFIVFFAIANREPVEVGFWPTPIRIDLPLYGVMLIGLFAGVILGGLAAWLASWRFRREAWQNKRRVLAMDARERLRHEQEELAELERSRERRKQLAVGASPV